MVRVSRDRENLCVNGRKFLALFAEGNDLGLIGNETDETACHYCISSWEDVSTYWAHESVIKRIKQQNRPLLGVDVVLQCDVDELVVKNRLCLETGRRCARLKVVVLLNLKCRDCGKNSHHESNEENAGVDHLCKINVCNGTATKGQDLESVDN